MGFRTLLNGQLLILLSYCAISNANFGPAEYDFVIVGGGAAGCLLASRLSEDPDTEVLLIEAGGEENILHDIPLFASLTQFTPANWGYRTEKSSTACLGLNDGRCNWPRGKVLGGSSVINYMAYMRGGSKDYDAWAALGNTGWSFEEILPYFLKSENMMIPELANDTKFHSTKGELPVTYPKYHTKSASVFLDAAKETGSKVGDYNGKQHDVFSYLQTTTKDGLRVSASTAFIKLHRFRKNLHIVTNSMVTNILINPETRTAYGVQYKRWKLLPLEAKARKEVIITAGSINSPQLLMLSGIGPKDHLEELGINFIQDLKVGYNLQDHITLGNLYFTANDSITLRTDKILPDLLHGIRYMFQHDGPFTITGGTEAVGFMDTDGDGDVDLEMLFATTTIASLKPIWEAWGARDDILDSTYTSLAYSNAFMMFPLLMHPKSRGRLMLRNKDPFSHPLLYHNYLTELEDVDGIIRGIKKALQLVETDAFQKHGARLFQTPLPPCKQHAFASDKYWECCIRHMTFTMYHQCGTCKMGPNSDPDAVVDPNLKVRGIKNLRVVDSSIIPRIPSAHVCAATYMIAEKGAAMIKQDWKIKN